MGVNSSIVPETLCYRNSWPFKNNPMLIIDKIYRISTDARCFNSQLGTPAASCWHCGFSFMAAPNMMGHGTHQTSSRVHLGQMRAGCDDIYYKCRLIMSGVSPAVNTVSSLSSQYHGIWSNASLVLTMGLYVGGQRLGEAGGRPRIWTLHGVRDPSRDVMLQNIHTLSLIYRTLIWR